MSLFLRNTKKLIVRPGKKPRRIWTGAFKGIRMALDLQNQTQLYLGLFEREVYQPLLQLSHGIKSAVDIGAYEGEYSLYFLLKTPVVKIFSFEPSEDGREQLLANLKLNGLEDDPRITISSLFVGSHESENSLTLDSLRSELQEPVVVKMDVDGAEWDILEGAAHLLKQRQVRWLVETHSPDLEARCVELFGCEGYVTTIIDNAWWRIIVPELRCTSLNRWLTAIKE